MPKTENNQESSIDISETSREFQQALHQLKAINFTKSNIEKLINEQVFPTEEIDQILTMLKAK